MAEPINDPETADVPRKSGLKPLLAGLALAVGLGGGGFYAVWSGLVLAPGDGAEVQASVDANAGHEVDLPDITFVPIEPIVVSLGPAAGSGHLRFRAELEVSPGAESDVTSMMPRIVDALNGFLRAVSVRELEDSAALILLRAQMLRRIQIIVGDGRVRGLLITEFVLS